MIEPSNGYTRSPRIGELVERFRSIGEENMTDLPIYNPALAVEAVGFQPLGEHWIGVLITPWFMNLVVLPREKQAMDMAMMGVKTEVDLPSGTWQLAYGGDDVVGLYQALSLHSPVHGFKTRDLARAEASQRLAAFLKPPEVESNAGSEIDGKASTMSRRAFLGGRALESRAEGPGSWPGAVRVYMTSSHSVGEKQ